jgi:hypothetical protein
MNDGSDPGAGAETVALAMDELADLTEEITRRLQDGEAVDLEEYARRFPRCAGAIRRLLPMLRGLATLARAPEPGCDKRPATGPEPQPKSL